MRIGIRCLRRSSRQTAIPSRPGSIQSRITRSGRARSAAASACRPSKAYSTLCPSFSRCERTRSERATSSSTINTVANSLARFGAAKADPERAAEARLGGRGQAATHRLDKLVRDRQPQPEPARVSRARAVHTVKALEDVLEVRGGDAETRVRYRDLDVVGAAAHADRHHSSFG